MTRVKGARLPEETAQFYDKYDLRKLMESLEWCVNMGILEIVDGEICVTTGFNEPEQGVNSSVNADLEEEIKNLSDACDEKGISIKDALRRTAQSIWSIRQ